MELLVTCTCGHNMVVSEYAAGMTSPCPKCGRPLTVSPKNSKPFSREAGSPVRSSTNAAASQDSAHADHSAPIYTPLQTASLKTHCARCGREFRGDWDRHHSAQGLICNICSNLVASSAQANLSSGYVAPIDVMKLDPVLDPVPPAPIEVEEVEKDWREKYMPDNAMMQRIAIGGAVAFGLYTAWLLVSGAWHVPPAPEHAGTAATAAAENAPVLPMWAGVVMLAMNTCSGFFSAFAGTYIFLMLSHRLPEDTFFANVIRLLPAVVVITALYFAAAILPVPFITILVTVFFVPGVIFVSFGFEAQDIVNFPLGMFFGGILQGAAYLFIYWIVGVIAL